jgi:hypothetical protein
MAHGQSPYRTSTRPSQTSTDLLNVGKWTAAFALFLALLALFTSLELFQITSEGAAKQTLRRSTAALTEIDALVARNYDELQRTAEDASTGDTVELTGFPIAVPLAPAEVRGESKDQIRDILMDRSAAVLYKNGAGALHDTAATNGSVGRFSVAGITRHGIGFLRSRNHSILAVTTLVLALVSAVLAVALAAACRGFGRLTSVGMVILAAAMPVVAGGALARFAARSGTDGDTEFLQREFLKIGDALAWIPIRDGSAFAAFGVALVIVGYACAFWADRREAPRTSTARAPAPRSPAGP